MTYNEEKPVLETAATEPTIWALRKNTRALTRGRDYSDATLHEHLFGYDPIRLRRRAADKDMAAPTSAENPQLNILKPETNFAVMELASDLEPEAS